MDAEKTMRCQQVRLQVERRLDVLHIRVKPEQISKLFFNNWRSKRCALTGGWNR
ncbi:uncharacterized protein TrAFT101_010147 [Trichoderma asperellum]|uniref:uncharacterized protein n=1 Tax=Trichoderma asperellum TaxID=101201 RepID=UPI00332CA1B8|nr:hypothetical protein TrAFT101_010147 [Trichoderma asperellum]